MRNIFFFFILIATVACSQKKADRINSNIFLAGARMAELTNPELEEASGLVASAVNRGMLWTLNDSGNGPEVFLVDEDLGIKLTCRLKDIMNRDWEDIATGPGPDEGKHYVYIGEIGDNLAIYSYKNIYRFEEPMLREGESTITISNFDTFTFTLEDGEKDSEALMVNPLTKDLYIISKRDAANVYELKYPYSSTDTLTAKKIISLAYTQINAADFSADGREILLKNYQNVYYWKVTEGSVRETLMQLPYIVEYTEEPQGEAIAFARDGSGFYTLSEKIRGEKSYLYSYRRK